MKLKAERIKNYTNNEDESLGELPIIVEAFLDIFIKKSKKAI
jgi:hypothetical protein